MNQATVAETLASRPGAQNRVGYLDTYRGIACLMVYFYHTAVNIPLIGVSFPGYYGVHLFFVLSGYLMSSKFIPSLNGGKPMPDLRKYLTRRFLRIYPPYLICLLVFVMLRVVSHVNPISWGNILSHASLTFNYTDNFDYYSINAVFWSLAIEIQFYLVLPVAVWLTLRLLPVDERRMFWFAAGFIIVGILSRIFESSFVDHVRPSAIAHVRFKWVTSHLDLFGVGILLRAVEWQAAARNFRLSAAAAWRGMAIVLLVFYGVALWSKKAGAWQESGDLAFVALCPLLACAGFASLLGLTNFSPLREGFLFRWRFLQWIGLISYSFYLYHIGVLFAFGRVFKPMSWGMSWGAMTTLTAFICLPVTIFVAWAAFRCFEKPFFKTG